MNKQNSKLVLATLVALLVLANIGCDDFKKEKSKPRVVYTDTYVVREGTSINDLYAKPEMKALNEDGSTSVEEPLIIVAEELILKKDSILYIEDRDVTFNVKRITSEGGKISTFKPKPIEYKMVSTDVYSANIEMEYGKSGGKITINTIDAEGELSLEMYGLDGMPNGPTENYEWGCGFDTPCPKEAWPGWIGADGSYTGNNCIKQPEDGGDGSDGRNGRDGYDGYPGGGSGSGIVNVSGSNSMKLFGSLLPGKGGAGGKGQFGQKGGKGGPPGEAKWAGGTHSGKNPCRTAYWGRPGKDGETGKDGAQGATGLQGKFCIRKNEIEQACVPAS